MLRKLLNSEEIRQLSVSVMSKRPQEMKKIRSFIKKEECL